MSERTTVSFRCSEGLSDILSEVADELNVSKSGLIRETLHDRLQAEDLDDLDLPEHLLIEAQRERIKRENRIDDLRGGFEGRVLDQFERRFERGYRTDDMRELAEGFVAEAHLLFEDEREAEAVSYVNSLMERFAEMREQSDADGLDPSEAFAQVEQEQSEGPEHDPETFEKAVSEASRRLSQALADPDAIADSLAKEYGLRTEAAQRAVTQAQRGAVEVSADD